MSILLKKIAVGAKFRTTVMPGSRALTNKKKEDGFTHPL